MTRSRYLEDLVMGQSVPPFSPAGVFDLFAREMALGEVVRLTDLPPWKVRELYNDFRSGYTEPTSKSPKDKSNDAMVQRAQLMKETAALRLEVARVESEKEVEIERWKVIARQRDADVKALEIKLHALEPPERKRKSG